MCDDECSEFLYTESNGYAYHICVLDEDEKCPNIDPCGLEKNRVMHERVDEKENQNPTQHQHQDWPQDPELEMKA